MAGGTWMSQNKVQPGVYINTKSSGNLSASIGEKGIVRSRNPSHGGPVRSCRRSFRARI